MSSTKLTLTISDPSIIEAAKVYAKEHGRSLSSMVENYLASFTSDKKSDKKEEEEYEISPLIKSITGLGKVPVDWDSKKALMEALEEKYL